MMDTTLLLILPILGFAASALVALGGDRTAGLGKLIGFLGFLAITVATILLRETIGTIVSGPRVMGWTMQFGLTPLSWYFVMMIAGLTLLTVVFSVGALRKGSGYPMYYAWLFAKTFGMFGVVLAQDLLTFFILWEMMSWATYFLMQQGLGHGAAAAKGAAKGYLIYALTASMVLFAGVIFLGFGAGGFTYSEVSAMIGGFPGWALFVAVLLTIVPMLVEAAVYPAHWWLPPAYAATETGITAYLAGISTRIGVYGVTIFLFVIFGTGVVDGMIPVPRLGIRNILMALGAFTMVVPTYTALFQHDAKQLIAWHGIGQGGYMIAGLATASALGVSGGLLHIFNYMTYNALIIFSIAAVEYRTGTTNLNQLGGLIKKQPIAYLGLLFGIIGLAGIPPMNGFVSKWLVYRSLILGGYPFIALAAFAATVGTILSVYKLIHNIFLGQLPERYNNIREVGPLMQFPIIVLMIVVFVTGAFPGTVLQWVAEIQRSLGLEAVAWTLTGVAPGLGQLNMGVVSLVFTVTFLVAWGVYLLGHRRKHVGQYDNYAAGHFLDRNVPYNFNYNFYSGFDHIFEKLYHRRPVKRFEEGAVGFFERVADFVRRIYTGHLNTYLAYGIAAIVIAAVFMGGIQ
jgi:NADH-quinone oxidoreductase subunit M